MIYAEELNDEGASHHRAIEINPKDSALWIRKGQVLEVPGINEEAKKANVMAKEIAER
jgi:hypothetical protein